MKVKNFGCAEDEFVNDLPSQGIISIPAIKLIFKGKDGCEVIKIGDPPLKEGVFSNFDNYDFPSFLSQKMGKLNGLIWIPSKKGLSMILYKTTRSIYFKCRIRGKDNPAITVCNLNI